MKEQVRPQQAAPIYWRLAALIAMTAGAAGLGACHSGDGSTLAVNGAIHVLAGQPATAAATVNGSIDIDDGAVLTTATTVNGRIQAGAHVKAQALTTVNGSIDLGNGAQVSGWVTTVNGGITLAAGSDVGGAVTNVSGSINLANAHVGGGIKTSSGNVTILGQSRVQGGILVEAATVGVTTGNTPRIVIGPHADVQGELRFERPAQLFVSDQATIGPVSGTTPIRFSGAEPPESAALSDPAPKLSGASSPQ